MKPRLIGPYVIEHRLATGGMAEVFVARREGPHGFTKHVALKRILPQYGQDPDFVQMFIDEARLAARLNHPNIVQVFDFGESDGELFLAMELVDGTNGNRLLRASAAAAEPVPLDVALHVTAQTAHGLAYAHRAADDQGRPLGFVHRDVSPANILLTRTGHVKVTDFGIARVADRDPRTDQGHVRGKLGYMSPEQVLGRDLDGRSDVFTLSAVLAEMLIGEPLFGSGSDLDVLLRIRDVDITPLERTTRRLPQDVQRLLVQGLAKKPDQRPPSDAFADACDEIMRRRGMAHGPERLARFLARLDLVEPAPGVDAAEDSAPGGRMTSLLDTTDMTAETARIVHNIGATSPAIYRVRLQDGRVLGPMSFPRLVQLITSGEVDSDTLISKEEDSFGPATQLPELTRFVTSPALQWKLDELERADRRGSLGAARLLPLVHRLASSRATGVLHLWDGERRKKIYLVEGRPEFVASTDKRELLGEYLVRQGLCLRMEVEMALALLPRYGGRLGDALVGLGVLRPVQLFRAITDQVRERFLEAFRWRQGQWAFVPGERSHEETFPVGQDPYELLRDAAMQAHPEELEAALAPVHEKVLDRVREPTVAVDAYRMAEAWRRLIEQVRGDATFGAILARELTRGVDVEDVYRAFYLALSCELVRPLDTMPTTRR
ncbi:MAG: protein kinase domain-containing protein [Myxococcota bacterium]